MIGIITSYILFLLLLIVFFVGYGHYLARQSQNQMAYRQTASWMMVLILFAGSFFYIWHGVPGLPDSPKGYDATSLVARNALSDLLVLETAWQENPQNIDAGLRFARRLGAAGQYRQAQDVYHALLQQLSDGDAPKDLILHIKLLLGENLTIEADGTVTDAAYAIFQQVLAEDAKNFGARYYLNLHLAQQGNETQAEENFHSLYEEAPQGSIWRQILAEKVGIQLPNSLQEIAQSASEMNPEERAAMIQQMVNQLAQKQQDNPENLQGWKQLARSYAVLQETDKQIDALRQGLKLAADDEQMQIDLTRALRQNNQGKDNKETIRILQKIYQQNPSHIEALWFLAVHQWREGKQALAQEKFDNLQKLFPKGSEERIELEKHIKNVVH